jgi:hypothetical protein
VHELSYRGFFTGGAQEETNSKRMSVTGDDKSGKGLLSHCQDRLNYSPEHQVSAQFSPQGLAHGFTCFSNHQQPDNEIMAFAASQSASMKTPKGNTSTREDDNTDSTHPATQPQQARTRAGAGLHWSLWFAPRI